MLYMSSKQTKQAVTLKWTKAHIGIDGNELADKYAKLGATADHNTQNLPITKNEINKRIEEKCLDMWQSKWGHYKHCLLYTSPSPRDLSTSRMPSSA